MSRGLLWRRRALLWITPLVLIVVNVVWLAMFKSGYEVRSAALERALERARASHEEVDTRLQRFERLWTGAVDNRERVERLYLEGFATEREHLTERIRLVKDLASRAGLEPQSISYPDEALEDFGLVRRSFVFSVEGTYADLRTFLHLLELAPVFVTVNEISVAGGGQGSGLGVSLRLSTFFEQVAGDEVTPAGGPPGDRAGGGA